MKILYHLLLWPILFTGLNASSQTDTKRDFKNQKSIQLNLGTQGIGAEFTYGGINAIPLKANDIFKIEDFNSTTHASADFYNIHVLADYTPFQKASWLRIVGGFAYFFKADGKVRITPSDEYTYGDLILSEEQIGYVDLNVDWKGAAPYLGLAFANTFPRKKFNVNFDLGAYYLSKPKADIIGTGLLEGNSSQTAQFQSNIKNYRWLPIVQVNFNYKF
jgi:hypothetical protein